MKLFWLLVMVVACGGGGDANNASVFDTTITDVVIEIDFETGQEPFTGAIIGFGDTFDLSAANIDRLFGATKQLTIPLTTGEMQDIGNVGDGELTVSDLLALADAHRDQRDAGATKTYYVVFVGGTLTTTTACRPTCSACRSGTPG